MPLINAHAVVPCGTRSLIVCLDLHLYPYFVYANALASLCICADSPGPSLLDDTINTGSYIEVFLEKYPGCSSYLFLVSHG